MPHCLIFKSRTQKGFQWSFKARVRFKRLVEK